MQSHAKSQCTMTPDINSILKDHFSAAIRQARIAGALGGRVAEQLVFGASQVTTGAGGDLQQVERMARAMVTQFGMSEAGTHNARTQYLCNTVNKLI